MTPCAVTSHSGSSGRCCSALAAASREQDRRKGKEQNPFTRVGASTPGQTAVGAGREVKMGALEELDDPGALQPEGEVTERPIQKSGRIVDRAGSPWKDRRTLRNSGTHRLPSLRHRKYSQRRCPIGDDGKRYKTRKVGSLSRGRSPTYYHYLAKLLQQDP